MADRSDDAENRSWLYHPRFPPDWTRGPLYSLATWINGMAFRNINFSDTGRPVVKIAEIKAELKKVKDRLGSGGASAKAAREVLAAIDIQ